MPRLSRPYLLILCLFLMIGNPRVSVADEPKSPAPPEKPKIPAIPPFEYFILTGEEPPAPFVPLKPRTVEDRKQVEATTAYSVARALEGRREWTQAISLLEGALKIDPDSVTLLRRLSKLSFVLGRTEAGVGFSKRVLAADPGDTDTMSRLVAYYTRRNDLTGAEGVLRDILANPALDKNAPGRLVAEVELGKLYSGKLRQIERAADAYARVVEALDDKNANRLPPADLRRVLGGDESAAYQEFGLVFLQAKRFELAAKAFRRGLDYEADDPQLPILLTQTYLKLDQNEKALTEIERFLKRQPQSMDGYELLAQVLTTLKRENEITPRLEEAAKLDSKNLPLQYALADRYREVGEVERAEKMYKMLLSTQPTAQGYGALAASLLKRKKADELLKVITEAINRPGGFDAVKEQIGGITNDPEFADQVLDAGLKMLSAEPPTLPKLGILVLADIAKNANKLEKFLPIQRLELKRNPSPQSYQEMLLLLLTMRKFGDLASTLEEMMMKYPDERKPRQLVQLAQYYRLSGNNAAAIKSAREALKLDPNDLDGQTQLAVVLSQTGKLDEAVDLLKAAVKRDPNNPGPALILGSIQTSAGRNEDAIATLKGLLEKFPNNEEVVKTARQQLSIAYVNLGDYGKGEAELEILLERDADDAGVNNDLGYLYTEQGKNLEKAEAMIRKAVQEEPENSAYLDSLGWVLFKRGKAKEAVEPLEKAVKQIIEIAPTDGTILEHLGDVYFQLQEAAKAKTAWESAEKAATKSNPPDKRLPEIRKKLESLKQIGQVPKASTGDTP